jgi:restriction endonuclease S subunit
MLKTISVNKNQLNNRFEPRYHYNGTLHDVAYNKNGSLLISQVSDLKSGTTPEHADIKINADDIFFIKSADVKRFNINHSNLSYITKEVNKKLKNSVIKPSDILITNTGKYLGFASYVTKELLISNINQNIIRIRLNKENSELINVYYLTAFLNSKFGQTAIESLLTLTGQKYLNMNKLRSLRIPIPEKLFLEDLTKSIEDSYSAADEALLLISEARKLFYEALSIDFSVIEKELTFSTTLSSFRDFDLWTPEYSNPLYIKTLNAISQKFNLINLGNIVKMKKGDEVGSDNYIQFINSKSSDVAFIRTSDIVNYECDNFTDFVAPIELHNELNQDLLPKDILFTKDGKIGMCGLITESDRVIIASGILKLRVTPEAHKKYNITPEYLFIVLSTKETGFFPSIRRTVRASTIPHLREDKIKDIEIPIIDTESIKKITKLVEKAFELKNKKKKLNKESITKMDEYFEKMLLNN